MRKLAQGSLRSKDEFGIKESNDCGASEQVKNNGGSI